MKAAHSNKFPKWSFCCLFLATIIVIGAFFRFYQLGHESLWLDEAYTGLLIQSPCSSWSETINFLTYDKNNPPLYYILLKVWANIFGYSEFSLRFMSASFSTLAIVLFYRIGKMLFSEKAALIAAALLAFSRYHIDFAQEARCYSLMGFLVLLSMYFLIRLWQNPTWGSYIGYVLASAGMLYNHYYAPFVIIMQNLFILTMFLLQRPMPWKHLAYWFVGQAAIGLCYLPWVTVLWRAINRIESVPTVLQTPGLWQLQLCFKQFSGSNSKLNTYVFFILACLSFYTILKTVINKTDSDAAGVPSKKSALKAFYLVLLWLVVPILLPFLYSILRAPIFSSRYTLISSYPFYLMIAIAISGIKKYSIRWVLVVTILLVSVRPIIPRYLFHNNEEWKQATMYIESNAQPNQALLFHAPFCGTVGHKFYAKRSDLAVLGFPLTPKTNFAVTEENINKITALVQNYSHVCLILSHSRDKEELILKKMRQLYSEQKHISFKGIEVYFFDKEQSLSPQSH